MSAAAIADKPPAAPMRRLALGDIPPLEIAWRRLARRFEQRVLRERLMLIAAAAAIAFMLADQLWLGAALKEFGRARDEQAKAQAAFASVQSETQSLLSTDLVKAAQLRAEIASWRERVRAGDAALRAYEGTLIGPDRMLPLLEQMLARHGGLRVRGMQSLGRSDLLAASRAPAKSADATAEATATLFRHGVELTVEGSFTDLLAYLKALEALPQRLLWGSVQLKADQYPKCTLTLRLYTVSRDRHFLEI
jgi:MSHA biogenesis protein MshJ